MFKKLLDSMAFSYGFVCKGRGKLTREEMNHITEAGKVYTEKAQTVLNDGLPLDKDQETDLMQAVMMEQHITEIVQFLLSQEVMG